MRKFFSIFFSLVVLLPMGVHGFSYPTSDEAVVVHQSGPFTIKVDQSWYQKLDRRQKTSFGFHFKQLADFYLEDVFSKVPHNILRKFKREKVEVYLLPRLSPQGLFSGRDYDSEGKLKLFFDLNLINTKALYPLAAHELFHAIHFTMNRGEETWVEEGLAQLFEYIVMGHLNGINFTAALNNPMTPLMGQYDITQMDRAQYGHNMLYFYYLYTHCGEDNLFWRLVKARRERTGRALIDKELRRGLKLKKVAKQCRGFKESALFFELARVHNETIYADNGEIKEFFLYPTNKKAQFPIFDKGEELNRYIKSLGYYMPYKMPLVKLQETPIECDDCQFFFSEDSFPFRLTTRLPERLAGWNIIIIKTL